MVGTIQFILACGNAKQKTENKLELFLNVKIIVLQAVVRHAKYLIGIIDANDRNITTYVMLASGATCSTI